MIVCLKILQDLLSTNTSISDLAQNLQQTVENIL